MAGLPDAEAHGAYVFCAVACMCILGEPKEMLPRSDLLREGGSAVVADVAR